MRNGAEVIRLKVCDDGIFKDPDAMLYVFVLAEESVEPIRWQIECLRDQGDKGV